MRAHIFRRFIEDLIAGDPVALTVLGILAVFALLVGLACIKAWYDLNPARKKRRRRVDDED